VNGRRVLLVLTVLGMALSVVYIGSGAAPVGADKARAEHERIVAFWTPERVAQAVPRDFVFEPGKGFRPAAKPDQPGKPKPPPPPPPPPAFTTEEWTGAGLVQSATGKILFQMGSSYYVCSGSVVVDTRTSESLVLTAAHCVFDESGRDRRNTPEDDRFATNWMFIPDYDAAPVTLTTSGSFCAQTTYGCWTASALVVHAGYATAGRFNTQATLHDFAFAVMGPGGNGGSVSASLEAAAGTQPYSFVEVPSSTAYAFGYPAASPFDGKKLWYCADALGRDSNNSSLTYRIGCDMTGGSSGGPWFGPVTSPFSGTGTLMSVNSYGYSGEDAMYGPIFNLKTEAVYKSANDPSTTVNTIVGP